MLKPLLIPSWRTDGGKESGSLATYSPVKAGLPTLKRDVEKLCSAHGESKEHYEGG